MLLLRDADFVITVDGARPAYYVKLRSSLMDQRSPLLVRRRKLTISTVG